jgi:hypothetical protein
MARHVAKRLDCAVFRRFDFRRTASSTVLHRLHRSFTNSHSPCQRQMPFAQHITPRIPRIMPSSVDTISPVLPISTNWRSACYQRWNPSGVCPFSSQQPPAYPAFPAHPYKRKRLVLSTLPPRKPCRTLSGNPAGWGDKLPPFPIDALPRRGPTEAGRL